MKIAILHRRLQQPDTRLAQSLAQILSALPAECEVDTHLKIGLEWARGVTERIRTADAVLALVSDGATGSEMLEYEIETAVDWRSRCGKPKILPIRIGPDEGGGTIGNLIGGFPALRWKDDADTGRLVVELIEALSGSARKAERAVTLESSGGGMSEKSTFYIHRPSDLAAEEGLRGGESVLLLKGPRQVGKTSLLARIGGQARAAGKRVVLTDFQRLDPAYLDDADGFFKMLAANLARQLRFSYDFEGQWHEIYGSTSNFDHFIRSLLASSDQPLVWLMDETDRIFGTSVANSFFALVRSWHNARATEPELPWDRLTVGIAYATEAHLFIQDLNQSPFNVGRLIPLSGFSLRETQELNERYGSPLRSIDQIQVLHDLLDGQPFLTRRAFDELVRSGGNLSGLVETAASDEGPFSDHLKRVLVSVSQLSGVYDTIRAALNNAVLRDSADVQRLVSAGILIQSSGEHYAIRCKLYRRYLSRHLPNA